MDLVLLLSGEILVSLSKVRESAQQSNSDLSAEGTLPKPAGKGVPKIKFCMLTTVRMQHLGTLRTLVRSFGAELRA